MVKAKNEQRASRPVPIIKKLYEETVRNELMKEFGYSTIMQAPTFEKVVLNAGVGNAIQNKKLLDAASEELMLISGQRPVFTKARKSISNFKLREGMNIGVCVTLRGVRMFDFLGKLIHIALPRVKDFRGLNPNSFDGHGNYSIGITEQIIFPEIDYDKIEQVSGFSVVIVTTASTDEEAKSLLIKSGVPFRKSS